MYPELLLPRTSNLYNILPEVPYTSEIIEIVAKKAKKEIPIHSIFLESTIIPEDRKKIFRKLEFQKFVEKGVIERKMARDVKVGVLLNEKEACKMITVVC